MLKVMGKFGGILIVGAVWFQKDPFGCSVKNNLSVCKGEGLRGRGESDKNGRRESSYKQTNKNDLFQDLNLRERRHWVREIWRVWSVQDLVCDRW